MGTVKQALVVVGVAALAGGCIRPAKNRALADLEAGKGEAAGVRFFVQDNLAGVREIASGQLVLWAQAPVLHIDVELAASATRTWELTVLNAMPTAVLAGDQGVVEIVDNGGPRPTVRAFRVTFDPAATSARLTVSPPDADSREPFRFAYMADIQTGVDEVSDLFERMNQDSSLRFVVMGGDLVEAGDRNELVVVQRELEALGIPMFATIGNHELFASDSDWEALVGPRNVHFAFRGTHFSLVDSGSATLDPLVYERLDDWLDAGAQEVHVLATHYPPFDPIGVRQGGFRSRKEAAKLFAMLSEHQVDAVFAGHIHSYYAFTVAGVPVFISGGGGADPKELLDGIDRHYLTVDVTPGEQIDQVGLVRIDD